MPESGRQEGKHGVALRDELGPDEADAGKWVGGEVIPGWLANQCGCLKRGAKNWEGGGELVVVSQCRIGEGLDVPCPPSPSALSMAP